MEERYYKWFDEGKIKECILGEGQYFLLDRDWQTHDTMVIIHYLYEWSFTKKDVDISKYFFDAVKELKKNNKLEAYRLFLTYSIVSSSYSSKLIPEGIFLKELKNSILKDGKEIVENENLRAIILTIQKYISDKIF